MMPHWNGQKILKLSKPHGAGPTTGGVGTGALGAMGATGTGAVGAFGTGAGTGAVGALGTGAVGATGTPIGLRTGLGILGDALGRSVCYKSSTI